MAMSGARGLDAAGTLLTVAAVLLAGCGDDGAEAAAAVGDEVASAEVADQVAAMRAATAGYADNLDAALDDPPILVSARDGEHWRGGGAGMGVPGGADGASDGRGVVR